MSRGLNPHIQTHDDTHATATAPGMDPGRSTRPRWAYEYAASVTAQASPHRQYNQPSRCPGNRDRISAPTVGKASANTMFEYTLPTKSPYPCLPTSPSPPRTSQNPSTAAEIPARVQPARDSAATLTTSA